VAQIVATALQLPPLLVNVEYPVEVHVDALVVERLANDLGVLPDELSRQHLSTIPRDGPKPYRALAASHPNYPGDPSVFDAIPTFGQRAVASGPLFHPMSRLKKYQRDLQRLWWSVGSLKDERDDGEHDEDDDEPLRDTHTDSGDAAGAEDRRD